MQADPAVDTIAMGLGAGVGNAAQNNGRMFITLKPRDERDVDAFQVIARLRPKLAKVPGARVYLQAAQDVTVGARAAQTQFQYTLQDADLDELNAWAPKILDKLKSLPELRDVATDQQIDGTTLTLKIDRDMAVALRHPAAADRRHALRRVRPAAGHAVLHAGEHLLRRSRRCRRSCRAIPATLDKLYHPLADDRPDGAAVSAFAKWTTAPVAPLSISHQGQFPAITISFNLAPGVALGQATDAIQQADAGAATAATV